jgi:hypothetical protein
MADISTGETLYRGAARRRNASGLPQSEGPRLRDLVEQNGMLDEMIRSGAHPARLVARRATTHARAESTSSSWSSSGDSIAGFYQSLINGPHFIPESGEVMANANLDEGTARTVDSLPVAIGSTWPPATRGYVHDSDWWMSMQRVGVLSMHELERQIGLPQPALRRSLGSLGSLVTIADQFESDQREFRPSEVYQPSVENDGTLGEPHPFSQPPSLPALQESNGFLAHQPLPVVIDPPLEARDQQLFEAVFNSHPFAAAAFLRGHVACSFCLLLFHIHSALTWPGTRT